jgi:hypothetical protein
MRGRGPRTAEASRVAPPETGRKAQVGTACPYTVLMSGASGFFIPTTW